MSARHPIPAAAAGARPGDGARADSDFTPERWALLVGNFAAPASADCARRQEPIQRILDSVEKQGRLRPAA